jgi:hypothetical protein
LAIVKVFPEPVTPEQGLKAQAVANALDQPGDRLRLIARRQVRPEQLERRIRIGDEVTRGRSRAFERIDFRQVGHGR